MSAVSILISVEDYLAHETKPASEYVDGVLRQKPTFPPANLLILLGLQ